MNEKTQTMLLNHDRPEAEEYFAKHLLHHFRAIGYSGEIHFNCFIVNGKGHRRRPDIYIPRYGFAIELDGGTRHSHHKRASDFQVRNKFYDDMGIKLLIIESSDVFSSLRMDAFKRGISDILFNHRLTPKKLSALNKTISKGRKILESEEPGLFNSSGSKACMFDEEFKIHNFNFYRHFGGVAVIFRSSYKKKPQSFFPKLDLSSPEANKRQIEKILVANKKKFSKDLGR